VIRSLPHSENEYQWSVNDFWLCILGNLSGNWLETTKNEVIAAFRGKNDSNSLPAPCWKWGSKERERFSVMHPGYSKRRFVAINHIWTDGGLFRQNSAWHKCYIIMKMIINSASTIFGLAYWVFKALHRYLSSLPNYWPLSKARRQNIIWKQGFQNNRDRKLQNMLKVITGCWISDLDNILLSNTKNKRSVRIYR